MVRDFENISCNKFNRVFPVIAPCDCHLEDFSTKYDIRVITGNDNLHVKNVNITCKSCGESRMFSVLQSIIITNIKF